MQVREQLIEKINSYSSLQKNWDGEDGIPASIQATKSAIDFLSWLAAHAILPEPMISHNGEVGLFWSVGNAYIDVGFNSLGLISYYAKSNSGEEIFGDELPLDKEKLVKLFKIIYSLVETTTTPAPLKSAVETEIIQKEGYQYVMPKRNC